MTSSPLTRFIIQFIVESKTEKLEKVENCLFLNKTIVNDFICSESCLVVLMSDSLQ